KRSIRRASTITAHTRVVRGVAEPSPTPPSLRSRRRVWPPPHWLARPLRSCAQAMTNEMVLNLVVTCSDRKTRPVPRARMLRSISAPSIDNRVQRWIETLEHGSEEGLPAVDLYAGDHWAVVRSLETVASGRGLDARIWV